MTSALAGGLGLALASALALDAGFLIQQGAVACTCELSLRRPVASLGALFASRRWLAGFCLGVSGWGLYFAALTLAPLSFVQTVAAGGICLLVVLAAIRRRALPARRERMGALLATAGLMALAASIGHSAAVSTAPAPLRVAGLAAACLVVVSCALQRRSAALGGLAAGLCYGVGDVTSKALLIGLPHHPGPGALAASPYLYATAGAHGLGFVVLQRAFQRGGPIASLGPMTAAANLLPMAAGVLLLGEALPHNGFALSLRVGAFAAAVAGAWVLVGHAAPAAADETPTEPALWLPPSLPAAGR